MSSKIVISLIFCIGYFSSLFGNPLQSFIKQEKIPTNATVKIVFYNVKDCVKCGAVTKLLHQAFSDSDYYYVLLWGIKEKKAEYFVTNILDLPKNKAHIIVNDSLFQFITPHLGTGLALIKGEDVFSVKQLEQITFPLEPSLLSYSAKTKDSIELKENVTPLNAETFYTYYMDEGKFLFYDEQFRNAIIYDLKGNQSTLFKIDSADIKKVYDLFVPNNDNWPRVYRQMMEDAYMLPLPYQLHNFYTNKDKLYVLVGFNFPIHILKKERNITSYEKGGSLIMEYDSNLNLLNIFPLDKGIDKFNYTKSLRSSFAFNNDTLYLSISNFSREKTEDSALRLFAGYSLNKANNHLVPFKICGKLPPFFVENKLYDYAVDNAIYFNKVKNSFMANITNSNYYYNFKTEKYNTVPDLKFNIDSTHFNQGKHFKTLYYYPGEIIIKDHFICMDDKAYYQVTTDKEGVLIRKIKLFDRDKNHENVQFFNDRHNLYAISSQDDKVMQYSFEMKDLE